jgi:hypothetical protein
MTTDFMMCSLIDGMWRPGALNPDVHSLKDQSMRA